MFLVLRLLASLFAPVPSRPNDATLRGAALEARYSQLTRDELDRELEHERRRRHALEAKTLEATSAAAKRNQAIADLRKELEATRYAAQDLERTAGELRTRNVEIQEDLDQARKSLEGLRVELEDTVDALEEVRADFLACAQAIGVVYEADGHPTHPGPVEDVVRHIQEALRAQGQAVELLPRVGLLEGLLASVRDRGEAVGAADGRVLYRLPPWLQDRINATLERRDGRPGDDPDQERQLLGRLAQVLELEHPERATLGDLEDEIATLHAQPAIAAAWVLDRAEQVDQSSARRAWADTLIAGLRKGEHLEAYRAGELDDLCDVPRKVDGIAVSPDHGGKS